jgi:hypothetical protein
MEYKRLPTIEEAILLPENDNTSFLVDLVSPETARQIAAAKDKTTYSEGGTPRLVINEYTARFLKKFKKSFDDTLVRNKGNVSAPFDVHIVMEYDPVQTLSHGWLEIVEESLGKHGLRTSKRTVGSIGPRNYCFTIVPVDWTEPKDGECVVM